MGGKLWKEANALEKNPCFQIFAARRIEMKCVIAVLRTVNHDMFPTLYGHTHSRHIFSAISFLLLTFSLFSRAQFVIHQLSIAIAVLRNPLLS